MPLALIMTGSAVNSRLGSFISSSTAKLVRLCVEHIVEGTLVTTRQKTLTGLTPENIQAMHIKQESGTMMGKQVLIL